MVSRGTTQQSSAPFNRRIVLDVVELVSLSPQTVANITNNLEAIGPGWPWLAPGEPASLRVHSARPRMQRP